MSNLQFWLFWSPLVVITIFAARKWWKTSNRDSILFFGFMLLLTSALYSVVILDLVVTNNTLKKAEATKEEITKIADLIVKIAFVLSNGSSRIGGTPAEHKAKLEEYASQLAVITKRNPEDLMQEVNRIIRELDESIKKRTQAERKN